MKIMSVNGCGLGGRSKFMALKCLVSCESPDILFLQESMGESEYLIPPLEKVLNGFPFFPLML